LGVGYAVGNTVIVGTTGLLKLPYTYTHSRQFVSLGAAPAGGTLVDTRDAEFSPNFGAKEFIHVAALVVIRTQQNNNHEEDHVLHSVVRFEFIIL
jgi:hypothetical protein